MNLKAPHKERNGGVWEEEKIQSVQSIIMIWLMKITVLSKALVKVGNTVRKTVRNLQKGPKTRSF